jgi:hypothetical protein
MSPYIPQRVKRAKQQITVKLYQDRLAMLDQYGRFIEDSRDYIIDQALDLVFKKDKDFLQWLEQKSRAEEGRDAIANSGDGSAQFRLDGEGGERGFLEDCRDESHEKHFTIPDVRQFADELDIGFLCSPPLGFPGR